MEQRKKFISPKLPKHRILLAAKHLGLMKEKIRLEKLRSIKTWPTNDELQYMTRCTNQSVN